MRRWLVSSILLGFSVLAYGTLAMAQTSRPAQEGLISLNLPPNTDLVTFIDYVTKRLGINVVYDESIGSQKLTLNAPTDIPQRSLLPLLENVLRMKGLAMVDCGVPGWKQVVSVSSLSPISQTSTRQPGEGGGETLAVTEVFALQHASVRDADATIKQFLSQPGGSTQPLPDQRMLIVTDYASNMPRLAALLKQVDRPGGDSTIRFVVVNNADATKLAQQVKQLVGDKARAQGASDEQNALDAVCDGRTNQIALIGPQDRVAEAVDIVRSLDVPVQAEQNPVRFYKLANATAQDVVATLHEIEGDEGGAGTPANTPNPMTDRGIEPVQSQTAPVTAPPNSDAPKPPAIRPKASEDAGDDAGKPKRATVVADVNTNTIIVVADPATQRLYEELIHTLDKRRPQVMLEATVVTLDTTDDFSLGVDVSGITKTDGHKILTFSSFGVSTVDSTTGQLSLIPGMGLNGAVLGSDVANVALNTLASNSRARVVASPRILVNDNMLGHLSSVAKQPYTSTNALTGNTSTTSFGGYADAGTEILLTPHISEDDYLQLEYEITLSSFTGQSGTGIPPPQQEDKVQSKVTIPDGSTIVVGGLNLQNQSDMLQKVPILGDIPGLKYLFSAQSKQNHTTTLFVFIRPVILRDDQFKDLKFLSRRDTTRAEIPGDFPSSEPMPMR